MNTSAWLAVAALILAATQDVDLNNAPQCQSLLGTYRQDGYCQ